MKQYWRLQQSQSIASLFLWTSTITLLVWPYVSWRFDPSATFLGISMTYWGLISIAVLVISSIFFIGYAYDQLLSLWKDHRTVDTERNPFATYQLMPQTAIIVGHLNELLRRQAPDDEEVIASCKWVDEWLEWCCKQEIWDRSQQFWDRNLPSQVPPLSFLPDNVASSSRERSAQKTDDDD